MGMGMRNGNGNGNELFIFFCTIYVPNLMRTLQVPRRRLHRYEKKHHRGVKGKNVYIQTILGAYMSNIPDFHEKSRQKFHWWVNFFVQICPCAGNVLSGWCKRRARTVPKATHISEKCLGVYMGASPLAGKFPKAV
jgi:hypothetical protein